MAAYPRDPGGVVRRIAADAEVGGGAAGPPSPLGRRLRCRAVLRAHSSSSSVFDFLAVENLVEGNPMVAVGKPRRKAGASRAISGPAAVRAAGHRSTA